MIATQKSRYGRSRYGFTANGIPFERRELKDFYEKSASRLRHNPFERHTAKVATALFQTKSSKA
jgi:hypothetical protein